MRTPEKAVFTNMCMISDGNGNVLVERRTKGWNGLVFPGGHLNLKETVTESVVREIYEETGLKIFELRICGVKQWFNEEEGRNVCFLFKTSNFEGTPVSSEEGPVFWMPLKDLIESKEVAPNFDMMLKVFLEDNINEMYVPDDGTDNFLL